MLKHEIEKVDCGMCKGEGYLKRTTRTLARDRRRRERCPACFGNGYIYKTKPLKHTIPKAE